MRAYRGEAAEPRYAVIQRELAERITSGQLPSGARIPSLSQITSLYGVSSITARRAVQKLLEHGLVREQPGRGMFVCAVQRQLRIALIPIGFSGEGWQPSSETFGQLVGGIAAVTCSRDTTLSVVPIETVGAAPEELAKVLDAQHLDGVVLRSSSDIPPEIDEVLTRRGVAYVSVKRNAPAPARSILSDDFGGSSAGTAHLIARGHKRIGLIVPFMSQSVGNLKAEGYRKAHADAKLPVDESLIVAAEYPLQRMGEQCAARLLDQQRPTAIFACSDVLALGVYDAARKRKLRIPHDLAVVGFDDQDFAAHLNPPLTTIRMSYFDLGRQAAAALLDLLGAGSTPSPDTLPVRIVVRASTQPYAGN